MLRRFLLPALALATLAGCATGYSYRGGNGDYYYSQPRVDYGYYGGLGYGYGYRGLAGFGQDYTLDSFGRRVYAYPYGYYGGYYGGRYPGYPYGYYPRPRPPHGPGHGHDGEHGGQTPPPVQGGHRPGNKPPWREIGRLRDREEDEQSRPRRPSGVQSPPRMQQPAPRMPAPALRERSEPRPAGMVRSGGSGERPRVRSVRPSANE